MCGNAKAKKGQQPITPYTGSGFRLASENKVPTVRSTHLDVVRGRVSETASTPDHEFPTRGFLYTY